jgi:hypothetical protein
MMNGKTKKAPFTSALMYLNENQKLVIMKKLKAKIIIYSINSNFNS